MEPLKNTDEVILIFAKGWGGGCEEVLIKILWNPKFSETLTQSCKNTTKQTLFRNEKKGKEEQYYSGTFRIVLLKQLLS